MPEKTEFNILIVDDEEPFVETLSKRLKKRNMNIFAAFNGFDALEALAQNSIIDVVILDVKMPGMDGLETLQKIKAKYPLVEVIMLTGHATVETAIEGMKKGASDYLRKPADIDEILKKVKEAARTRTLHEDKIRKAQIELAGKTPREILNADK